MGQQIRKEIVGQLLRTSNTNVSLAQSVLNIGGQQYATQTNLLMNISTSGFGGLDTGTVLASRTYHLYAVVDGSGAVGLITSLNLPAANGPVGFPNWKYLWSIHTDQSSFILDFQRVGKKNVFIDTLGGITTNPDFTGNNPALLIDFGSPYPAGAFPSNNFTFTTNMLNGLADEFQGLFLAVGDGGASGFRARLVRGYPAPQGNIAAVGAYISGVGVLFESYYIGKVGESYTIEMVPGSLAEHDLVNKIISYDNKLVDESSSAGTIVNINNFPIPPINELWLRFANGYGSTNTFQKRWSAIQTYQGTAFTYQDSSTGGATITINEDGLYAFSFTEETNSNSQFGITLNQSDPTKAITQIVDGSEVLNCSYTASAQLFMTCSGAKWLHAGDVLRTVSDAAGPGTYTEVVGFRIEKIANAGASGVVSVGPRSEVFFRGGAGHGAVDTFIRRFATFVSSSGTDISYTDNANNGTFFTINTPGIYAISYSDASSSGAAAGITLNSPNLNVGESDSSNTPYRLGAVSVSAAGANQPAFVGVTLFLNTGDIIRAHSDSASTPNGTAPEGTLFRITKVNN